MSSRALLRKQCIAARESLSASERRQAALQITRRLRASSLYWGAEHIAFFWPVGAEVDLRELMWSALRHGKRCYLPLMRPGGRLWFLRYREHTRLEVNRYGIPEPRYRARDAMAPERLDLVFVPLLGFDRLGTRLGMGGGFYDRAFAFKRHAEGTAPKLVGVAYACQEIAALPAEAWDVPLSSVATERELIDCRGARKVAAGMSRPPAA